MGHSPDGVVKAKLLPANLKSAKDCWSMTPRHILEMLFLWPITLLFIGYWQFALLLALVVQSSSTTNSVKTVKLRKKRKHLKY